MSLFESTVAAIQPLDESAMADARARQDTLTKPPGALGRLEDISIQLAGITGQPIPRIGRKVVVVFAADHGVTAEGVSAYPSEVTPQMVANFEIGGAAINVLARHAGADVRVIDMGVGRPTYNIARGPAMSPQQAIQCIGQGIAIANEAID